jgi:hypothetical protein
MERLSDAERSELWDRWEAGEFQRSVARALDPPQIEKGNGISLRSN